MDMMDFMDIMDVIISLCHMWVRTFER